MAPAGGHRLGLGPERVTDGGSGATAIAWPLSAQIGRFRRRIRFPPRAATASRVGPCLPERLIEPNLEPSPSRAPGTYVIQAPGARMTTALT
jgi:hypothetical protein